MTSWVNLCPFIESIHPDHKRVWIDSILWVWTNSKCHWRFTLYVMAAMLWQLCCGGYAVSALLWRLCCGSYALVMAAMIGNKSYFSHCLDVANTNCLTLLNIKILINLINIFTGSSCWKTASQPTHISHRKDYFNEMAQNSFHCNMGMLIFDLHDCGG